MEGHNGYISVNLGGKQRGVKFGMYALTMFSKRTGKTLVPDDVITIKQAADIVYCGLVNNCIVKEVDTDFTYEDVTDWVEEMFFDEKGQETLSKIIETFSNSRAIKHGQKLNEELDESKKNLNSTTGTPLNPSPSEKLDLSPLNTTD